MDTLKLVHLNDPILHRKAKLVPPEIIKETWFQQELEALVEAMRTFHGVGIAATQVGIDRQVFICEVKHNERYPDQPDIPLQIYINPVIKKRSKEEDLLQEGCLSLPETWGEVPRACEVTLVALDREGKSVKVKAEGFLARIFQHECDHLEGHIFLERVRDMGSVIRSKK